MVQELLPCLGVGLATGVQDGGGDAVAVGPPAGVVGGGWQTPLVLEQDGQVGEGDPGVAEGLGDRGDRGRHPLARPAPHGAEVQQERLLGEAVQRGRVVVLVVGDQVGGGVADLVAGVGVAGGGVGSMAAGPFSLVGGSLPNRTFPVRGGTARLSGACGRPARPKAGSGGRSLASTSLEALSADIAES